MINEKQAIEYATLNGIQVTDTVKHKDGRREFKVGALRVHHDNDGGKACWRVEGQVTGYLGHAIHEAVLRQVQQ